MDPLFNWCWLCLKRCCVKPKLPCLSWGLLSWRQLLPRLRKMNEITKETMTGADYSLGILLPCPGAADAAPVPPRCRSLCSIDSAAGGVITNIDTMNQRNAPERVVFRDPTLRNGFHLAGFCSIKVWFPGTIMRLCHLLPRLAAVKESKKTAPSLLAPRAPSPTPSASLRVRHQRFRAPVATAREARILWRHRSYTGDSTTGWRCFGDGSKVVLWTLI